MGADPLRRRFLGLAVPNVTSNLLVPLAGLVDVAMLGHYGGVDDLAGVALGAVLFDYLLWTFGFLRMGTTGLTAQAHGRGDAQETADLLVRGLTVALVTGLAIVLLQWPLRELGFGMLEGATDVKSAGRAYYDARIWGAPVALSSFVVHGFLLGLGRGREVLLLSAANNLTNIVLDYLLIAHLGLGAAGAGYATVASHAATCLCGLPLIWGELRRHSMSLRPSAALDLGPLRQFLRLGRDIMVRTFALLSSFALFIDFSAVLGTERLASNSLVLKVVTLSAYLVDGYAFSVESLAGQLHGAGEAGPLRRLLAIAAVYALATATLFALAFNLFPQPLFGLLTDHREIVQLASADTLWLWPILLVGSLAYLLDGYFLGLAAGRILSRMMVLSLLVAFVPAALWARAHGSSHGLWAAFLLFTIARTVTLALHLPATWRTAKRDAAAEAQDCQTGSAS